MLLRIVSGHPLVSFSRTYKDEVASNIGCAGLVAFVCTIKVSDIVSLKYEHDDPVYAGDDRVQGKGCRVVVILSPDRVATLVLVTVIWRAECVVYSYYYHQ